jgi:ribosomal protein S18 acetylase RimI-like enzyme
MIRRLNLRELDEVHSLLDVQRLAYSVEAILIAFYDIPPLKDTLQSLQSSKETFYGYFLDEELNGAISYTRQANEVNICRLVVHPKTFRQGIASALVEHVLVTENDASRFTVSTGLKNLPAVKLYKKYGFVEIGTTEVSSGVFIVHFEKRNL